jgi:Inositol polyphosphate kinase
LFVSIKKLNIQIDIENSEIRNRIIKRATRRASTWMNLSTQNAIPMVGQVGGASRHKRTVLTLEPEYVLKPLLPDHRGLREIAFYEAIEAVSKQNPASASSGSSSNTNTKQTTKSFLQTSYAAFLKSAADKCSNSSSNASSENQQQQLLLQLYKEQFKVSLSVATNKVGEVIDTLALAFAMLMQDRVVMESELALKDAWRAIRKEAELLHKVVKFTAPYYGLLGQPSTTEPQSENGGASAVDALSSFSVPYSPDECPYGVSHDAHLLLQDLTINYKQPCVMDLKMGTETFEPDAPDEKRLRESSKYPQQAIFGFRIVGMRIYDPLHPEACDKGYRFYGKDYGRSLTTTEQVRDAFRIYFGGVDGSSSSNNCATANGSSEVTGRLKENADVSHVAKSSDSDSDLVDRGSNADRNGESKEVSSPDDTDIVLQKEGGVTWTDTTTTTATATTTTTTTAIRFKAISSISQQIRLIRGWFDDNTMLRFCASSLLIVYEGDVSSTHTPDVTLVRMIDFGRVRRRTGGDPGYRHGLRTLSHLLGDLVDEQTEEDD